MKDIINNNNKEKLWGIYGWGNGNDYGSKYEYNYSYRYYNGNGFIPKEGNIKKGGTGKGDGNETNNVYINGDGNGKSRIE